MKMAGFNFLDVKDWLKKHYYTPILERPGMGKCEVSPTFDPQLGYEENRQERVMIATQQELDAARIDARHRDYCSHTLLAYMQCKDLHKLREDWYCHHQFHAHMECKYEDLVIRMKEYEREKRLQARAARKIAKLQAEEL